MSNFKKRYCYSALCMLVVTTVFIVGGYFVIPNACHQDKEVL